MFKKLFTISGVFLVSVILMTNGGEALRCWDCSTGAIDGQFCDDPFDPSKLSSSQMLYAQKTCDSPNPGYKAVCKKLKQTISGVETVKRSCYYQDIRNSNNSQSCVVDTAPANVVTKYCSVCSEDVCNGATKIIIPAITMMFFPILFFILGLIYDAILYLWS